MTEDEAKTKWCPFARDSNTGGNRLRYGAGADDAPPPEYGREAAGEFPCIASQCMAWRWSLAQAWCGDAEHKPEFPDNAINPRFDEVEGLWTWNYESDTQGYCGLAGRPE